MKFLVFILAISSTAVFSQNKRIIDKDTRYRISVFTESEVHKSIGLIIMFMKDGIGLCTGTVISPRHVVTAAHCLAHEGQLMESVVFLPGVNEGITKAKSPLRNFKSSKLYVMKGYSDSSGTENDLGVISFSENLPVDAIPVSLAPLYTTELIIAGYPGDKITGTLWEGKGNTERGLFGGSRLAHDVDTYSGQSGSAVRAKMNGTEKIVGIHSSGVKTRTKVYNEAVFFNPTHLRFIESVIQKDGYSLK